MPVVFEFCDVDVGGVCGPACATWALCGRGGTGEYVQHASCRVAVRWLEIGQTWWRCSKTTFSFPLKIVTSNFSLFPRDLCELWRPRDLELPDLELSADDLAQIDLHLEVTRLLLLISTPAVPSNGDLTVKASLTVKICCCSLRRVV